VDGPGSFPTVSHDRPGGMDSRPVPTGMSNESRIRVELYEQKHKAQWDEFVRQSKNGVFLFYRDYMEYHADRFSDFSLLFFQGSELVALMPANRDGDMAVSHGGLTFGGVVSDTSMTTSRMLEVFSALVDDLRAWGVKKLLYKVIPHIYHLLPAEEDLYALFVHCARLYRRDVSSTVVAARKLPLARNRERVLESARCRGLSVQRTPDVSRFMSIVEGNLQARYRVSPVHTASEMQRLADRFPDNIKLFTVDQGGETLGGVLIYESENVAHWQYRHATEKGMEVGALDFITDAILNDLYRDKPYVDFGISTLDDGHTLNTGLIRNKEGYGARATVCDFYELNLET